MDNYGEIIIYQTEDGLTKLEVKMENDTVGKNYDVLHYKLNS